MQSQEIGMACYSTKWYNLSHGDARDLVLVMQRASDPLKMWAGQFVPFSMELFGNVSIPLTVLMRDQKRIRLPEYNISGAENIYGIFLSVGHDE